MKLSTARLFLNERKLECARRTAAVIVSLAQALHSFRILHYRKESSLSTTLTAPLDILAADGAAITRAKTGFQCSLLTPQLQEYHEILLRLSSRLASGSKRRNSFKRREHVA